MFKKLLRNSAASMMLISVISIFALVGCNSTYPFEYRIWETTPAERKMDIKDGNIGYAWCRKLRKQIETKKGRYSFDQSARAPRTRFLSVNRVRFSSIGGNSYFGRVGDQICERYRNPEGHISYFQTKENEFTFKSFRSGRYAVAGAMEGQVKGIIQAASMIGAWNGYRYGTIVNTKQDAVRNAGQTESTTRSSGSGTEYTLYGITFNNLNTDIKTTTSTTGQSAQTSVTQTIKFHRNRPSTDNYFDIEIINKSSPAEYFNFNSNQVGIGRVSYWLG